MKLFGLHILDVFVILIYVILILWIGKKVSKKTNDTNEFFLAGRKLGKVYQFFLNFGCSTNSDQAVAVSREVYRQGIGGMWIQFLVLFLTPFYWFTTCLFRRVRLTTIGDFFTERFKSKGLGGAYAVFILIVSIIGGGVGFMVGAKTMMALTPKAFQECTVEQQQSILNFRKYQELKIKLQTDITVEEKNHYDVLNEKMKRGELHSFYSYTNPLVFYICFALVVGVYTMLGGFRAAAITDSIQGVLIILFSCILIPVGLQKIGGFAGLHASVPDFMFELFGSASLSEYGWYTILAMALANLVSIVAVVTGMQTSGSAKDEMTARIGMMTGMFFKRFIMIFWALAGLLAIGLYAGKLHDPDLIWGYMARDLLFPGAIGLLLVGILAANMSTLDATSVSYSALFINNLYKPVKPGKSETHYLNIGKIMIAFTLLGGVMVALVIDNLLELYKYIISIPAIFGASIWLGFTWRRLTKKAVFTQVVICIVIMAIIPNLFPALKVTKYNQSLLMETNPKVVKREIVANESDVKKGHAEQIGQVIIREHRVEPFGVFFEKVARDNPDDPQSRKVGLGRFHTELWIISWFGVDFQDFSKSWLTALRFLFDAIFPFILLFLFSYFSKPVDRKVTDKFFAKMHTPIQPTMEAEEIALCRAYENPGMYEKDKIFKNSNWELLKPTWKDYLGFFGAWVMVGVVILVLWLVVNIK